VEKKISETETESSRGASNLSDVST